MGKGTCLGLLPSSGRELQAPLILSSLHYERSAIARHMPKLTALMNAGLHWLANLPEYRVPPIQTSCQKGPLILQSLISLP